MEKVEQCSVKEEIFLRRVVFFIYYSHLFCTFLIELLRPYSLTRFQCELIVFGLSVQNQINYALLIYSCLDLTRKLRHKVTLGQTKLVIFALPRFLVLCLSMNICICEGGCFGGLLCT